MKSIAFIPTFGNRPYSLVGRGAIIADFKEGLEHPEGHPNRAFIFTGQRGMGKTALLLEFADIGEKMGYIPVRVSATETMLDDILQTIQIIGSKTMKAETRKVKSVNAGAFGFSFGLTFTDDVKENYGFRIKLSLLADELAKQGKGILFLIDEVQSNTPEMREFASAYQQLIGDGKNIAIAMAGLPASLSAVLNDKVLTFLNRSRKVQLEPLQSGEVGAFYAERFRAENKKVPPDILEKIVQATKGYPYQLQLIGYYILKYSAGSDKIDEQIASLAIRSAKHEMIDTVLVTALAPLSENDLSFLKAMSKDKEISKVADVRERLKKTDSYVQQYRRRLMDAGVIASRKRGTVEYSLPYLGEYLRGEL